MAVERDELGRLQPGSVLNPNGRPRVRSWTDALRRELDRPCTDEPAAITVCQELGIDPESLSVGELIIRRRSIMALTEKAAPFGWVQNIADMHDRVDGKPTQRMEHNFDGTIGDAISGKSSDLRQSFDELDSAADAAGGLLDGKSDLAGS